MRWLPQVQQLVFDATGGGKLASQILTAMEISANKTAKEYSRYGSTTFKQVYIYGGLDRSPTTLNRAFGMSWALGGWLLTPFIGKIGMEKFQELRQRVADEIKHNILKPLHERSFVSGSAFSGIYPSLRKASNRYEVSDQTHSYKRTTVLKL